LPQSIIVRLLPYSSHPLDFCLEDKTGRTREIRANVITKRFTEKRETE